MITIKKQMITLFLCMLASAQLYAQDTLSTQNVEAILYTGNGQAQPLIVGLGGSEGGNAWTSTHWKTKRDEFIKRGYAFLAIGYFACPGAPKILDRIEIKDIYKAIAMAKTHKQINPKKIAVIGGSRGADLALLLGSYYKDISCVVGMSASHAVFPGHTQEFTTSCWRYDGKELPFVPVNDAAIPFLIKRDLRKSFETMLLDTVAERAALIKVEQINGPILLLSGKADEIIPATAMGEKMIARLNAKGFKYRYEHITFEGNHAEPTKHFDSIFRFLDKHFISR